jgi:hypothetical protein
MVSVPERQTPFRGCCVRTFPSASVEGGLYYFIGGRRLGAWEAVVFGEPHVEDALAMVERDSLLSFEFMVLEASVTMLIRLVCVLITLHTSNGSVGLPSQGVGMITAGGCGTKPFHHSGIEMPILGYLLPQWRAMLSPRYNRAGYVRHGGSSVVELV